MWLCRQAPGDFNEPVADRPHTFGFSLYRVICIVFSFFIFFFFFLFSFTSDDDNDETLPLSSFFHLWVLSEFDATRRRRLFYFSFLCYLLYTSVDSWRSALTTRSGLDRRETARADGDDDDDDDDVLVVHPPLTIVDCFQPVSLPRGFSAVPAVHSLVIYLSTVQ